MNPIITTPLNKNDVTVHLDLVIELAPKEVRSEQGYIRPGYEQEMTERFVNTFADEEVR